MVPDVVYRVEWSAGQPVPFYETNRTPAPRITVYAVSTSPLTAPKAVEALRVYLSSNVYPMTETCWMQEKHHAGSFSIECYSPEELTPGRFVNAVVASIGEACEQSGSDLVLACFMSKTYSRAGGQTACVVRTWFH